MNENEKMQKPDVNKGAMPVPDDAINRGNGEPVRENRSDIQQDVTPTADETENNDDRDEEQNMDNNDV